MTKRRLLSLVLPHLAAEAARKRLAAASLHGGASFHDAASLHGGEPGGAAFATYAMIGGAARLEGVCPRAAALGLRAGMALADARAMRPTLVVAPADPAREARRLAAIADWCRRWTPLAAVDAECGVSAILLDVGGAAHLFGGEERLARDVETAFRAQGFSARACVAASPEAARALARFSTRHVAPEGRDFERLADALPLAALELPARTLEAMRQAGLRRVGDVRMRPRAPATARFGALVHDRIDGLFGLALSPISPRFEAPPYLVERRFAEPLTQEDAILATLERLAGELCAMLARHGEGARRLDAAFFRVDGATRRLSAGAAQASRDPAALARLFRERLKAIGEEGLDTGYGFDVIRLSARRVERLDAAQDSLDGRRKGESGGGDFAHLLDRLGARLGAHRVMRLTTRATHQPEQAGGAARFADAPASRANAPAARPRRDDAERRAAAPSTPARSVSERVSTARVCEPPAPDPAPHDAAESAPDHAIAAPSRAAASGFAPGSVVALAARSSPSRAGEGAASGPAAQASALAASPSVAVAPAVCGEDDASTIVSLPARAGVMAGVMACVVDCATAQTSHVPRGSAVAAPALASRSTLVSGVCATTRERLAAASRLALPARPLRLFERPEPVEAIAEAPDGPPLRFRWRRALHEVVAAEGPERIAADWRRGAAPTRDYYRVEDREGRRFWLFREGLLARETALARWFAHGLFA